jgi:5-methylcytosine-specific restriction endonuclease McrA
MIQRKVAVIHEYVAGSSFGTFPMPRTLRLIRWVETTWRTPTAPGSCSKRAIRERDDFTCCYCGEFGDTVDHVFPISRGGHVTWLNAVTACQSCNWFKADRTPEEAGMAMLYQPFDPSERTAGEQSRDWAESALVSSLAC